MCATLFYVEQTRNLTLHLPERLLKRMKVLAATRETSVSAIVREMMEDLVEREDAYHQAMTRHIAMMRNAKDRGTAGTFTWTRDSLHERSGS